MPESVIILTPLYNDWEALGLLLERIQAVVPAALRPSLSVLVVNDCSNQEPKKPLPTYFPLTVLHLTRNVGHQKAIALGLAYLAQEEPFDRVVVMDSDGEDKPEDIPRLVEASRAAGDRIIFAHRSKRSEGWLFRKLYVIYKLIFRLLTGKVITFGNFCIMPREVARKLSHVSEIWNHFPGGIIRSKLPYDSIPIERGVRLAGKSKMNFISLILHGMSAVSVMIDVVSVRLLVMAVWLIVVSVVGIVAVTLVRIFTEMAIPGWASFLIIAFGIILLQVFLLVFFLIFIVLQARTQLQFIPAKQYVDYLDRVERVS